MSSSYRVAVDEPAVPDGELLCFHHAGGGSRFFREWGGAFRADLAISVALLPGRERRFGESIPEDVATVADEIADEILRGDWALQKPLVLFGHSLGTLVGYEVARRLEDGGIEIAHFIASGRWAPSVDRPQPNYREMSDEKLREELLEMGGTPQKVLDEPELMELYLPIIRSDLSLGGRYERDAPDPLEAPLTAIGGDEDETLQGTHLEDWSAFTDDSFEARYFSGGHFFLQGQLDHVLGWLERRLRDTGL